MTRAAKGKDVLGRLDALRQSKAAAANDTAVPAAAQVNPSPQMRKDLGDVCAWYEKGLGWPAEHLAELRADYQALLQRTPFDVVGEILAKSAALARQSMARFEADVAAMCAERRSA